MKNKYSSVLLDNHSASWGEGGEEERELILWELFLMKRIKGPDFARK